MDIDKLKDEELIQELSKRISGKSSNIEITRLKDELRHVNEKLKDSESLKSHFISNISNEIINPFTSVLAITENILGVDKENWKKVISMVALIHSEVFNLDFQLKNIFAAAKIEAGEIEPEISLVNVNSLIDNLIHSFKYEAKRKQLKIVFAPKDNGTPIFFKTDSEKLRLIIANLLSNAIKFSYDESEVLIHCQKNEDELAVQVQDFGQGISEANEQIIFDRFSRVDTGINSINRGHGLGLSINKALIDVLEGHITHKSKLGKGATFSFTIKEAEGESSGISTDANEIFFKEEKF